MGWCLAVIIAAAIGGGLWGCGTGLDDEAPPETILTTLDDGGATSPSIPTDEAEAEPREAAQDPEAAPGDGGTTAAAEVPDTIPPTITTVRPATESADVATDTIIELTWSEAIDPATVTTTAVSVVTFTSLFDAASTVAGTLMVTENLVTFTPTDPLAAGRQHTVIVTTDVRDVAGNALAEEFRSSFTTRAPQGDTLAHIPDGSLTSD